METEIPHDGLSFLQTNRSFLGREFLTWLWFTSEVHHHKLTIDGLGEYKFFVDDKLVLSSSGGSVHENSLRGGTPAYAAEAHLGLLSGKLVSEAKFILQDAERQWIWNMKAEDLSLRSVRLPAVQEPDAASHISGRISLMQHLVDVVDVLFQKYMAIRVSKDFEQELVLMGQWLAGKSKDYPESALAAMSVSQ